MYGCSNWIAMSPSRGLLMPTKRASIASVLARSRILSPYDLPSAAVPCHVKAGHGARDCFAQKLEAAY